MTGELRNIQYWNPIFSTWQNTVPTFFYNRCGLRCTAVNISGQSCYFFMYWYGFDSYGNRLYQHVTNTTLLAPGEGITDSIEFFCNLPGTYAATCQLYAWPVGESARLVDSIGTLEAGTPIAYVTGVPEAEGVIDTWQLWDWETGSWVRPSPTVVPLHETIGIQGVGHNITDFTQDMKMEVRVHSPSGAEWTLSGDIKSVPAGQLPSDYPRWDFLWEATEYGDWKADLFLYAGSDLVMVDSRSYIAVAHVAEWAPVPEPEFRGFGVTEYTAV